MVVVGGFRFPAPVAGSKVRIVFVAPERWRWRWRWKWKIENGILKMGYGNRVLNIPLLTIWFGSGHFHSPQFCYIESGVVDIAPAVLQGFLQ